MSAQIDDDTLEWIERELSRCVAMVVSPLGSYVLTECEMQVLVRGRLPPAQETNVFPVRSW